ncbi:MAG: hypothetical protein ABIK28_08910 [Planctomycetota bacterium]
MGIKNLLLKGVPNISELLHDIQSLCGVLKGAASTLTEDMSEQDTREFLEGMTAKASEIQEAVNNLYKQINAVSKT